MAIAPEIAILYNDLKVTRVPWSEKHTLRQDGVLAIAVLGTSKKRNQYSIYHDYYQLVWSDKDCCLTGHDGDYGFFSFKNQDLADWRFPFILPDNCIEFEGVYVNKEDWQIALEIFSDTDGSMF